MEPSGQQAKDTSKNANKPQSWRGDYISPSRLRLWLKCPAAYKKRYIDGIVTPTHPNLFLGKVVHAGLEHFYRHRVRSVTLFSRAVVEEIHRHWDRMAADESMYFASREEEETLKAQASALVATYIDQLPNDEPLPIAVEAQFTAPLVDPGTGEDLGIPLLGIVDLVLPSPTGPVIIDFKTAARSSAKVDILHELQLSSYSYLSRQLTGCKESALEIRSLIKTKVAKIETHSYAPREDVHFDRLFAVVRAYLRAMDEQTTYIRPGFECSYCDFQETCLAA